MSALISFEMGHCFGRHSSEREAAEALNALLEALVAVNIAYLKQHRSCPSLYASGVRYGRTVVWDPIPALYQRGYGDCKSLSAALVAEYRMKGIPCRPVFRFNRQRTLYHILVETPRRNGYDKKAFEDPSRKLGMDRRAFG
jgi:hypothetical protein